MLHAALGEPADGQKLAREARPLTPLGLTHELKQLRVATSFEHICDCRRITSTMTPQHS
jgi:hypothetical protein